jgi:isopentenyldiphosphate isomerase
VYAEDMNPIETYEVLDEQGHKTGQVLDRQTVHRDQLWHETVNVWIINSRGELLMQLRAPKVELSPDVWDVSVGTHLRPSEAPDEAALRALKNTYNLEATTEELKHIFNLQSANPMPDDRHHNVFEHVFLLHADLDTGQFAFDNSKIAELKWVPLNQLMIDIGNAETKKRYFPRATSYYPQLFEAFQAWM